MDTDNAVVRGLTLRQMGIEGTERSGVYIPRGRLILEDCVVASSVVAVEVCNADTNSIVRRCHINDINSIGIVVYRNASGTFEDCEIVGNILGIVVRTGANPIVRRCHLVQNKNAGVFVYENGAGTFENCRILNNGFSDQTYAGFTIQDGGNPTLRGCTISGNKGPGIYANTNARGTVENCDLRGNGGKGAFDIDDTSQLVRRNNQEA